MRSQEELIQKWSEMNAIFQNAAIVLALIDIDVKVVHINRPGIEMFGKEEADIIGLLGGEAFNCINAWSNDEVVCGRSQNCSSCVLRTNVMSTFANGKNKYKVEGSFSIYNNGKKIDLYLSVSTSLIKILDKQYVLLSIDDITDLKNQKLELQELNETKTKFFSILAHDLKGPFSSIIGLCEHLVKNIDKKDFEKSHKIANSMLNASTMTMDLLSNLLTWSQLQSERIEINSEQTNLRKVVEEVIRLLSASAENKNITIYNTLLDSDQVYADKNMINTVLRNLISNAIKFTFNGGNILISCTKIDNNLVVKVRDNGTGMNPEIIEGLFKIAESQSIPGTANEKGTGLGLILCREFIEMNNGKIWVESEEGKGSSFYFSLPVKV